MVKTGRNRADPGDTLDGHTYGEKELCGYIYINTYLKSSIFSYDTLSYSHQATHSVPVTWRVFLSKEFTGKTRICLTSVCPLSCIGQWREAQFLTDVVSLLAEASSLVAFRQAKGHSLQTYLSNEEGCLHSGTNHPVVVAALRRSCIFTCNIMYFD